MNDLLLEDLPAAASGRVSWAFDTLELIADLKQHDFDADSYFSALPDKAYIKSELNRGQISQYWLSGEAESDVRKNVIMDSLFRLQRATTDTAEHRRLIGVMKEMAPDRVSGSTPSKL